MSDLPDLKGLSDEALQAERQRLIGTVRREELTSKYDADPSSLADEELEELKTLTQPLVVDEKQQRRDVGSVKVTGPGITSAARRTAAAALDAGSAGLRTSASFLDGVNTAVAKTLGMPVDLVNQALSLAGVDTKNPVLGSRQLEDAFRAVGAATGEEPDGAVNRFVKRAGETIGGAAGMAATAALAAPKLAATAVPVISNLFKELLKNPTNFARRELGAAVPAGVTAAGAEEGMRAADVPEESTGFKVGSLISEIVGGVFGAKAGDRAPSRRTPTGREEKVAGVIAGRSQDHTPRGLDIELGRNAGELEQIPGYRPTTAQASEDTGILRTERDAKAAVPGFEADLSDRLAGQMEAARDELSRVIGKRLSPTEAGTEIRTGINDARKVAKTTERAAWKLIDPKLRTPFDKVIRELWDIKNSVKEGERATSMPAVVDELTDNLVQTYGGILASLSKNPAKALEDVQSWRSRVSTDLREEEAQLAPDARKVARLEQLSRKLNEAITDLGTMPGDQGRLVRDASKLTRERATTYDEGPVGKVRQRGPYDGSRIPESDVADQFVSTGKPQPENFLALVKATGSRSKAVEAAKSILAQNLERSVASGEGLSVTKLDRFMESPSTKELLRAVYSNDPNQLARLNQIRRNLTSRAQSTRPLVGGASTTTEKLTGSIGLEQELKAPRLLDRIIGARIPSVGGQVARAGAGVARGVEDRMHAKNDALTFQLFRDAMLDPELARDLLRRTGERADKRTQQRIHGYLAHYAADDEEGEPLKIDIRPSDKFRAVPSAEAGQER